MTQALHLERVSARYGATTVLHALSLDVAAGEFVSLLGASGCGKTTTLRLIAGFLQPSAGSIRLGERDLTRVPAHRRNIGLVFQTYALFPHLTVLDNVAFGLKQRGVGAAERHRRAAAMLQRVGLPELAGRAPSALSGGQRQRVALARALVIDPALLMFDEPLSNLDAKLRVQLRVEIREMQRASGSTAVYVTHDQEEAFAVSDRVAIMRAGRIEQLDTPERLYRRPDSAFVARFVGFENLLPLRVLSRDGASVTAELAGGVALSLSEQVLGPIPDRCILGTRAEGLVILGHPAPGAIPAVVGTRTYLGRAYQYTCDTPAGRVLAHGTLAEPIAAGQAVGLSPVIDQCCILGAETPG